MHKILFVFTLLFSSVLSATTLNESFLHGSWQADNIMDNSEDLPTEYKILADGIFIFQADGKFIFTSANAEIENMLADGFWQWNAAKQLITIYHIKNNKSRPSMTIGVRSKEKQIYFIILEAALLLQMQKISN